MSSTTRLLIPYLIWLAFLAGGLVGTLEPMWDRSPAPAPAPVPHTIVLGSEDELCIDIVFNRYTGVLQAEVWRGDPDTCIPIQETP